MIVNTSIYIPRINVCYDYYKINTIFEYMDLGYVSRVDFVPIGKKHGFAEHLGEFWRSVFVYVTIDTENENHKNLLKHINDETPYYLHLPEIFEIHVFDKTYWILLKNKSPVKNTWMNVHQIVDNCRFLEEKIETQNEILENQSRQIENLQKSFSRIFEGIYYQRIKGKHMFCNSNISKENRLDTEISNIISFDEERIQNSFDLCGNN